MVRAVTATVTVCLAVSASAGAAQTLRGSAFAMQRQNDIAQRHDYTFLQTSSQVRRFVDAGYLVRLGGNADYELAAVSHPYGRPAVKLFIERLAGQYHAACGEKLVVTSLTRPTLEQPRNASDLSVHPAGMAVDLRISNRSRCRSWLERTLLSLERQGLLDVTRERRPPHYHVALFPTSYEKYVTQLTGRPVRAVASAPPAATPVATSTTVSGPSAEDETQVQHYRVNRGDSLWSIARRLGTTVDTLKELNGMTGSAIVAGQVISVPVVANGAESN